MSEEARALATVRFCELERPLTMFARALANRPLRLSSSASPPAALTSDGMTIWLPAQIASFASATENRAAYRVAVLRQVSALLATLGFELASAAHHGLVPLRAHDGLAAHGAAPSELTRFFSLARRPARLRRVFRVLEELRIDAALPRRYPGARRDLARVRQHALASRPVLAGVSSPAALFEALRQYSLGARRALLVAQDTTGQLTRLLCEAAALRRGAANIYDSARAALRICGWLELAVDEEERVDAHLHDPAQPDDAQAESGEQRAPDAIDPGLADYEGSRLALRGNMPSELVDPHQRATGAVEAPALDAANARIREAAAHEQATLDVSPHDRASPTVLDGATRSYLYDEWDYLRGRYLRAFCRVHEASRSGEELGFLLDVRRRHALVAREVRRSLRFDRPALRQRVHRQSEGHELDLDAVLEAIIDRKRGRSSEAQLHVGYQRAPRDVCAAFLVDTSGSTSFGLHDPGRPPGEAAEASAAALASDEPVYLHAPYEPPARPELAARRCVLDVAKESLVLMCDALHALGDRHAIFGFSSAGRQQVEFVVAKSFDQRWSARAAAAVASMASRGSTRTGAAIRHASSKLARESARTRVLIVLSDGYPDDVDYGPRPRDIDYGLHDTARALQEAERSGIATFCIAIDAAGHDYLRRMCREQRYLVVEDVDSLPRELTKIYRTLTAR